MSVVALDWDGTCVVNRWPEMGDWLPGAVSSIRTLVDAGHRCYIYSARCSPLWPDGSERDPAIVFEAVRQIRDKLDSVALPQVTIWEGCGKPHWDLLVDDKSINFPGKPRSWRVVLPKVLAFVKDEDTFASVMEEAMRGDE